MVPGKEVVVGPPVEEVVDETAGGTDDVVTVVWEAEDEFSIVDVTPEGSVTDGV